MDRNSFNPNFWNDPNNFNDPQNFFGNFPQQNFPHQNYNSSQPNFSTFETHRVHNPNNFFQTGDYQDSQSDSVQSQYAGFDLNSQSRLSESPPIDAGFIPPIPQLHNEDESPIIECTPTRGKKTYSRWDDEEDLSLISAWLGITKDPNIGTDQKSGTFWDRILNRHTEKGKYLSRTPLVLKKHWQDISKAVGKFVGVYSTITRRNQSGYNHDKIMTEATRLYFAETGSKFRHESHWRLLKDEPKFLALLKSESASQNKRNKVNIDGEYTSESNADDEDSEARTMERPIGQKASKRNAKGKGLASGSERVDLLEKRVERVTDLQERKIVSMDRLSLAMEKKIAMKRRKLNQDFFTMDTTSMNLKQLQGYNKALNKLINGGE